MDNDSADETIFLTKDLAAKAFNKWHADYADDPDGFTGGLEGQLCADYFFDLLEAVV